MPYQPSTMTHTCNPSTLGHWGRQIMKSGDWDHPGQHCETPCLLKYKKLAGCSGACLLVPATREAEEGESLVPGRWKLQWAEIMPLHFSLATELDSVSKKKRNKKNFFKKGPGMVAHTCNPNTLGGRGRWITWGQSSIPAWPTWGNPVSTKNTKISWAWWCVPVIPATREAEMGELLEPGGRVCSELRLCHCTPFWATRANLHLK